jgi:hypothetical protein
MSILAYRRVVMWILTYRRVLMSILSYRRVVICWQIISFIWRNCMFSMSVIFLVNPYFFVFPHQDSDEIDTIIEVINEDWHQNSSICEDSHHNSSICEDWHFTLLYVRIDIITLLYVRIDILLFYMWGLTSQLFYMSGLTFYSSICEDYIEELWYADKSLASYGVIVCFPCPLYF